MAKHHCVELHGLAVFCHGCLSSLHMIGIIYNARRKSWWDVTAHSLALAYSAKATVHHVRMCQNGHMEN